jgi:hypothetical protein
MGEFGKDWLTVGSTPLPTYTARPRQAWQSFSFTCACMRASVCLCVVCWCVPASTAVKSLDAGLTALPEAFFLQFATVAVISGCVQGVDGTLPSQPGLPPVLPLFFVVSCMQ